MIIEQKVGYTLPYNLLENAVYNNPDGFGLILKDPTTQKLQIIKRMKCDPKEIYDLLKDNEDIERYLHVRYKTEGEVSEENLHPFTSYFSDDLQIEFMHNGTLHSYKPSGERSEFKNGVRIIHEPKETISDSNKFNRDVLQPLLQRFTGENGKADYHDPVFKMLVDKFWCTGYNQGLLVSNKYPPLFINQKDWKVIKVSDNEEFYASNDLYFRELKRGPEFERRKKEKEEREKEEREKSRQHRFHNSGDNVIVGNKSVFNRTITQLKNVDFKEHQLDLSKMDELLTDIDLYTLDGLASMAYMSEEEVDLFIKGMTPKELKNYIIYMTSTYEEVYGRYSKIVDFLTHLRSKGKISDTEADEFLKDAKE